MRILIIDDDRIALTTVGGFLSECGHEVAGLTITAACETHRNLLDDPFDLIIADQLLATRDLEGIVIRARRSNDSIPLIVMSGIGTILPLRDALSWNVYGYLRKPISLKELHLMITRFEQFIHPQLCASHHKSTKEMSDELH